MKIFSGNGSDQMDQNERFNGFKKSNWSKMKMLGNILCMTRRNNVERQASATQGMMRAGTERKMHKFDNSQRNERAQSD